MLWLTTRPGFDREAVMAATTTSPISSSISSRRYLREPAARRRPAPGPVINLSVAGKAQSSTGKAIASFYYLAQYLREQSRTVVE